MDLEVDLEEEMVDHLLTYSLTKQTQRLADELLVGEVLELVELLTIALEEQLYVDVVEDVKTKDLLEQSPFFLSDPRYKKTATGELYSIGIKEKEL